MKIKYNTTFQNLLKEYSLPENLKFDIIIPKDVEEILDKEIVYNEYSIHWKEWWLKEEEYHVSWVSYEEDLDNHFHVDWYAQPKENKECFMLWVKTIILLTEKLLKENISWVKITYSFQSAEMSMEFTKANNLHEDWDEYFIWDRLSFYKIREWEDSLWNDNFENKYWGLLHIEI